MTGAEQWDPDRYLAYADERGRPFVELLARVGAERPATVVDLGCGPGSLTVLLQRRWPTARVVGVDSSAAMVERARAGLPELEVVHADVRDWLAGARPADVVLSNAMLQWVPDHLALLPALVAAVRPGGWLAFQVPGNFGEPSHVLRRELAAEPPYAALTAGVAEPDAHDAATYQRALATLGCGVDAWETTYLHVLDPPRYGEDPVFTWISGTGARPTLQALGDLRPAYEAELRRRLRAAYPDDGQGVVMPFRRVFVVARVPG
ncbi:MAG: methyltransferase domain-containing protein [Marmoricola sp.]